MRMQTIRSAWYGYPIVTARLVRLPNLLILAFTQYFTAIFLIGPPGRYMTYIKDPQLLFLTLSTMLIAAAGYVINDYYDVKIDIINKPNRLVIGRYLSRRQAIILHFFMNATGFILSTSISIRTGVITALSAFLLWWYSNYLKRLPFSGNAAVSSLTGLSLLIVGLLYQKNELLIMVYATFAFLISLIREIIKDMEDVKGDKNFGCTTIPIKYGLFRTKKLLYLIQSVQIIMLATFGMYKGIHLFAIYLILVIFPLFLLAFLIREADTKKDFTYLSKLCKYIMLSGIFSMIFI